VARPTGTHAGIDENAHPQSVKTLAALVLGIVGLLLLILLPIPLLSIIGLVLAYLARKNIQDPNNRRMNTAALVLNWIGIAVAVILWLVVLLN
jgi:uncharacterized membrane protein